MVKLKKRSNAAFGRKIDQVLDGAWRIFLRDGYAGAGVDDIARTAGVSKATLYAYFPDKQLMFQQAVKMALDRPDVGPLASIEHDFPVEPGLTRITAAITEWLHSEPEVQLVRLAIGEANRFPALTRAYHERTEKLLTRPLADRLEIYVSRGELDIGDTALAARQLIRLCGLTIHDQVAARTAGDDRTAALRPAEMFLRAYGSPAARNLDGQEMKGGMDVASMR